MEISNQGFVDNFRSAMMSDYSDEDKRDFFCKLFENLVLSEAVQNHYEEKLKLKESVLACPSSESIKLVADQTFNLLMYADGNPESWDLEFLKMNLDVGVSSLFNRELNGRLVIQTICSPSVDAPTNISYLLKGGAGADISDYNLFRLAFENQNPHTLSIVQALLDSNRLPTTTNLHRLLVVNSKYTLDIFKLFIPYKVAFTPSCLSYVLKYSGNENRLSLVTFLLNQGVIPDQYHVDFARKHCDSDTVSKLEFAFEEIYGMKAGSQTLFDFFECYASPRQSKLSSIESLLKKQNEYSLPLLLENIKRGNRLSDKDLKLLITHPQEYTFEIFRLFLICGFKLSVEQMKGMIEKRFPDFEKILQLSRLYGHIIPDEIGNLIWDTSESRLSRSNDKDPYLLALEIDVGDLTKSRTLQKEKGTPIKTIVAEYLKRAPGLYELMIRSGVHPSLYFLNLYCSNRQKFFDKLLHAKGYLEANSRNRRLFSIAIGSANGNTVRELVKRGFKVTPVEVIQAVHFQMGSIADFLMEKMFLEYRRMQKVSQEGASSSLPLNFESFAPKLIEVKDENDLFQLALSTLGDDTKKEFKRLIESGETATPELFDILRSRICIYTPELIKLLERRGWRY